MPRTIKEHFEALPEPYRQQALQNMNNLNANSRCERQSSAIDQGMTWVETPQGRNYWSSYKQSLQDEEDRTARNGRV